MKHLYIVLFVFICGSLIAQPANDLCSAAQSITPDGSCVSGTTLSGSDNWTGTVGCQTSGGTHPDVWYSFVSTGNSYVGTVTTSGSWSGNVEFTLVSGDCINGFTLVGDACGASPLSINIPGLTVGVTYYFTVSEKGAGNAGPFQVCSSTPLATIPTNDDCSNATSLGTLPAPATCGSGLQNGTAVVIAGTNVAATEESPYVSLNGCGMASPANSVWYSFVQPVRGYGVTINVSGGTLANPNIALWNGTTCSSLSGVNCIVGSANAATLTVSNGMTPGQTYYIQLSGNTGESGTYNLSVNAFQDCSDCLSASTLTVSPLPVNGMYDPGQTVSFCFHIDRWTQTVNNWLHGVQMAFGSGWDLTTLTATPPPAYVSTSAFWGAVSPASCGNWAYYPNGTTSSASGVLWPAGFYFDGVYNTNIFGTVTGCGSLTGNPGNNFGDGISSSGLVITPPANQWNFCWTVNVKTGCNPGMSLSVAMNTSGDGESGSWTSIGCTNDPSVNFTAQISCCPPTMSSTGTCAGFSNGTATATPDGAAAPYTYSWSAGGQNTQTITGLAAGTYTVTVVDANLCTATASVSVATNANPTTTPTASPAAICNGASTALAANATAGSGAISTYAWSSGLAGNVSGGSVSPTANTTYTVTVTNSNTCTATASVSVTVNAVPTVAPAATPTTICNGGSTTLAANATAGSGAISTYAWSSGLAGNVSGGSLSPTSNTTYTVTVTNSNTCTATGTVSVTVNAKPTIAPTATPAAICNGGITTLAANATAGSGAISTYAWSSGLTGNVSGGSVSPTANTTYTVTVTNSNTCTATASVSVTVNAVPTVAPAATPTTICNGGSTTLAANATAGSGAISTYAWSSGLAGNVSGGSVSPTTITTYTVTVTNSNLCTVSASVLVTVNAKPTVAPTATPAIICNGQSATLAANATAGSGTISTYAWSSGLAGNVSGGSVSPAATTTYTVTVTNSNLCTATGTVSVTVNAVPTVAPTATPSTICNGGITTLTANATAGSGAISTYAWSSGLVGNVSGGSVSPSGNTTYTVTVTNSNSCTATGTVSITVNAIPTVAPTATPATICNGQSTTLAANATAGSGAISTYAWSSGLAGNVSGGSVSPTTNTTYTVTVTNSNLCTATASVSVTVNAVPTVAPTATPSAICNGQSTTLAANAVAGSGAISTYAWSSGLAGNVLGGSVSPVANTTYTVTVTNSNTCTATASVLVTVNANPSVTPSATPAAICNGGITTLAANATAGSGAISTYAWSSGLAGNVSGGSVSPTANTTYTVTVTNSNTCTATASVSVTVNAVPTVAPTATPSAICNGQSTTLAANAVAGSGVISTYAWSSGLAGNVSGGSVSPVANTTYTVTVTNSNTCTATASVLVTVNANPSVTPSATPAAICSGGITALAANATAGSGAISTYAWSSGLAGNVSGGSVSPITNTTYTVTVTNSNTCTATASVSVTVNAVPTVAPTATPSTICNGQSTTLAANATAGSGAISTYAWSSGLAGNISGGSVAPITNTTYTVTVTNSNLCTATASVLVTVNANPTVAPIATPDAICNGGSSTLAANAAAGSGVISTYTWSSGLAGNISGGSVSPVANTTYTVTVTNSNTCTATASILVTVNANPSVTPSATPAAICNGESTTLAANATAGSGAISTYTWSGGLVGNVSGGSVSPTTNTTYTVTVTNSNTCTATASVFVTVNTLASPTASNTGPYCATSAIQLNAGGGTSYSWSGPSAFASASQNPTRTNATTAMMGTYTVTVTDANGCSATATTSVVVNSSLSPIASNTGPYCVGGVVQLNVAGGNTYSWSGPNSFSNATQNPSISNATALMSGTYDITATDLNGCSGTASTIVTVNANPTIAPSATPASICNGQSTTLAANATPGSGAISTYAWSSSLAGNVSGGSVSPTANTTYTVTITNSNSCTVTGTISVTVNANPTVTPSATPTAICNGESTTLAANATAGSGAILTYVWSSGLAGNVSSGSVSPTANTTFTVTVTDANTCSATGTISVTVNANPTVAPTATPSAICNGQSTALAANATAGSGAISTYVWSSGLAGNVSGGSVSPTANTTFMVTVTDANTCSATGTVSVTVNTNPTVAPIANPTSICVGGSTLLAANAALGSGTISTYTWSSGLAGNISGGSVSPVTNTTYTVTVTDANTCSATGTVSITVNANPTIAPTATPTAICNGGSSTLASNATAGSGVISTYTWSSGLVGNISGGSVSPIANTTYTVTVTNSNTCTATANVTVTVNPLPSTSASNTGPYCIGATIQLHSSGGNSYSWSGPNVYFNATQNPTIANSTAATNGTYSVTVTDVNGCTSTASTTVTVNALPIPSASNTGSYCVGATIQLNSSGGNSYSWSGPSAFAGASQNPTLTNATLAMAGTYTVTVTDANSCSATTATSVVVNNSLSPVASNNGAYCAGATIQLNVAGGTVFSWSGPNGFNSLSLNPSIANSTTSMSGTYSVTATDANGCSGTASTTVVVNSLPVPSTSNTGPYCAGATIQLNSSGGNSYSWSGPNVYSNATQNPTIANSTVAMSGTYSVTVTNVNGCSGTASTVVVVNSLPAPSAFNTGPYCAGATIQLNSAGGNSYSWSGPNAYTNATQNPIIANSTVAMSGTYSVTVTDMYGCSGTASTTVVVNSLPVPSASNSGPYCSGATIQLNSSGGNSYSWSGPNVYTNATQNPSIVSSSTGMSGVYTVTVTDANSCSATASATVVVNSLPVPSASNSGPYCAGATIQLSSSGGNSYSWSGPNIYSNATQNPSIASSTTGMSGVYTVTVTDANSCSTTASTSVTVNTNPTVAPTAIPTSICNGGSSTLAANATAGSGAISTYAWSSGLAGNISAGSVSPVTNTTYTVTVTDANTCSATGTVSVTVNTNPTVAPTATPTAICNGGSSTLAANATAGSGVISTYAWSSGLVGNISGGSVSPIANTTYTVTVTNSNTCTATASIAVTVNPLPSPTATNTGPYCTTSTIQLNVGGGNSYSWSGPSAFASASQNPTRANATLALAGTYTVTVTDANGCSATATTDVVVNSSLAPVASNTGPYCAGGTVQLNVVGGNTFLWSGPNAFANALQNPSINNATVLMSGTYDVTATDLNGCSGTASTNVVVNALPVSSASNTGPYCAGVIIHLNSSGGNSYSWSGPNTYSNAAQNPSITNSTTVMSGTYSVTVTDANSCTATASTNVVVNALPVANAGADAIITCAVPQPTLNATAIGLGETYLWSGPGIVSGGNTATPIVNANGTYTLLLTDANTCTATEDAIVTSNTTAPNANAGPDKTLTCAITSVALTASSTTGGVSFAWSNGINFATNSVSVANTYIVTVTDPINGCTASDNAVVSTNTTTPNANAGPNATLTCAITSVTLTATSITAGVSFAWSNGINVASNPIAVANTYTVTVTDPTNGCTASDAADVLSNTTSPNGNAGTDQTLSCSDTSIQLIGSSTTAGVTYSWSGGGIVSGGATATPTVNVTGTYTLLITDPTNGCTANDATEVLQDINTPNANAGQGKILTCTITQIGLAGSSTTAGVTYNWSGPGIISGGNTSAPIVNVSGTYTLTVTDPSNGCSMSDQADVTLDNVSPNANAGADQTLTCAVLSVQLNGSSSTAGATFSWSGAGIVSGGNTATPTVNATGTYTLLVTDPSNGCTANDAADVISNTTAPNANAGPDATLTCVITSVTLTASSTTGGVSFAWSNGINVAANSVSIVNTYTVTVTDPINGCTASDNAVVSTNTTTPNANAGPDATLTCAVTSVTLTASSTTGGVSFAWSNGIITAVNSVSIANTYTVTVTDTANGCTASDIADVISNTTVPNVNAGTDATLTCAVTSATLTASSTTVGVSFAWYNGINTANNLVSAVNTYTVTVTDPTNGCTASDAVDVTSNTTAPNANAGPDKVLTCTITSATLTASSASAGVSFAWSTGDNTASTVIAAVNTYTVTVTDAVNGCTASDQADVTSNTTVPNADAGPDKIISCTMNGVALDGSSTTLNATFNWSGTGIVSGANTSIPFVNLVGTYTLVVTDPLNGCTASDAADVVDPNAIILTADVVDNPCAQLAIGQIDLQVSGGFTPYNYLWTNNAVTEDISNLHGGTYSVTVTDNNGCTVSNSYLLNEGFFTIDAQQNSTINLGETVQLTGTSYGGTGQETYVWSPDYHLTCADCSSPIATPYTDMVYVLQATDITGCTGYDTVKIHVIPLHDIFIPNVFTPNGDGNNDFFSVYGKLNLLEFFEVKIFNRWGEKVFESNNANFMWDGSFKGVIQNPQVFVYTIKTTFIDGYTGNDYKGSVTLIR